MKRFLLMAGLVIMCIQGFSQQQGGDLKQYMLIVRFRTDAAAPDAGLMKTNGQHWGEFFVYLCGLDGWVIFSTEPEGHVDQAD